MALEAEANTKQSFGRSVYTPRTHTVYTSALRYQDRGYSKAKVYTMRTLGALGDCCTAPEEMLFFGGSSQHASRAWWALKKPSGLDQNHD